MPKEKFKLSETLRFLSRQINAIAGAEDVDISLDFEAEEISPGEEFAAKVRVVSPEEARTVTYVVLSLRGTVQRGGKWREYSETAEVAQGTELDADHEIVIPLVLYIPEDAVLTEDGAEWVIEARAVLDKLIDPRTQRSFSVVLGAADEEEE